uniref:snRNA-activating protein complex subunit 3 n=1 Tax=Steinernema glaseri TaxID=37863 RepID=A0A1I7Z7Q1_9BILA
MQETSPDEEKSPKTENDVSHNAQEASSSEQVNNVATISSASPFSPDNASVSRHELTEAVCQAGDVAESSEATQSTEPSENASGSHVAEPVRSADVVEQADTSGSPTDKPSNSNGPVENNGNHWSTSPSSASLEPLDRKIKVEECVADTSAHSDSSSLEGTPTVSGSTCNVKEEAQTTTDDMGVERTNSVVNSMFAAAPSTSEAGEAECAQPNGYTSPATLGDQGAVPSCSSTEPSSTVNIVNGEGSDSTVAEEPSSSTSPKSTLPMSRICLTGDSIYIPTVLCEDEELLRSILSVETLKSLPEEKQTALKKLLPSYEKSDEDLDMILECAFSNDEFFCYGNTLSKLFYKLECNWYSPDRPCEDLQLRDNRRVMYDHFHRHYYISMLRRLLISRHRILEKVSALSGSEEGDIRLKTNAGFLKRRYMVDRLQERAKRRCQVMFNNIRGQVGESDLSSDDEDDGYMKTRFTPNNSGKYAGKSTLHSNDFVDIDLHQPLRLGSPINMLEEYMHLKEKEPDCMSLDISDIAVDEVYERSGVSIISERNFATMVRKRRQAEEEKCEADSSTDIRTNGHCSNHSGAPDTPHSHSVEEDEDADNDMDHDGNYNSTDDVPDTSSVLSVNGIHSEASDNDEDDEDLQFEESLRKEEEANNLSGEAHSPAPS